MQQHQCFLRCRHALSSGQSQRVSLRHLWLHLWHNRVSVHFCVMLKNNVQPQEFNKVIAGVLWRNITSIFVLMILAKLSGMKLTHGTVWYEDLNNILLQT